MAKTEFSREEEMRFAVIQQKWHGWGSPVGAGIGFVAFGVFVWLLSQAAHMWQ